MNDIPYIIILILSIIGFIYNYQITQFNMVDNTLKDNLKISYLILLFHAIHGIVLIDPPEKIQRLFKNPIMILFSIFSLIYTSTNDIETTFFMIIMLLMLLHILRNEKEKKKYPYIIF